MRNTNSPISTANLIFDCAMALIYLAIAYTFLFTSVFDRVVSDYNFRLIFGVILGLYGLYRIYRAINRILVYRRRRDE